jgi:hypothetical protein
LCVFCNSCLFQWSLTVLTEKFETVLRIEFDEPHKKVKDAFFSCGFQKEVHIIMVVNEAKLHEFIAKAVNEWGASAGALITFVDNRLGLFKAMDGDGALTPEELAKRQAHIHG